MMDPSSPALIVDLACRPAEGLAHDLDARLLVVVLNTQLLQDPNRVLADVKRGKQALESIH
jgi:hypothetical protein